MTNETQVDRALRRLTELNNFVFALSEAGRKAGLHNRIPWRERLEQPPPDAVPLYPEEGAGQEKMVADSAEETKG